jgi:hypothetical protein
MSTFGTALYLKREEVRWDSWATTYELRLGDLLRSSYCTDRAELSFCSSKIGVNFYAES